MKKIIFIVTVALLFSSCNSNVGIKGNETNQNCEAKVISKEQLADLLLSKDLTNVQFIDIRTPKKYVIGHLPKAINIPIKNFFDKSRFESISKDKMLILYGEDISEPKMVALLASHFNKGSFYIAGGGYEYIEKNMLHGFGLNSGVYDDEIPLVDFQEAINEIKGRSGVAAGSKPVKKAVSTKPIVKKKKKAVSGGCG